MAHEPKAEDRLRVLEAISDTALGHLGLDKVLRTILESVREVLQVDTASVLEYDSDAQHLVAIAASGIEEEVFQGIRVPVGAGFAGRVAAQRHPIVVDQVDETTVVNVLLREKGLKALLGVPMLVGDELIGVLHVGSTMSRDFADREIDLLQIVAGRLALALQVESATTDRAAAAALQRSLLPGRLPKVRGLEFAARYVPGTDTGVGGDWYDLFVLPGDRVGVVMGDVVGNGLTAAVVMGRLRSALRAYSLETDDPAEVLSKLDRKANHFEHDTMATVAYGIFDASHEKLCLSLAGHLPPVLATPGSPATLVTAPADPPIGLAIEGLCRRNTIIDLPVGGVLAFYTDGLVERRQIPIEDGMRQLVEAVTVDAPAAVCAHAMASLVGANPAHDDIALLVVRRHTEL